MVETDEMRDFVPLLFLWFAKTRLEMAASKSNCTRDLCQLCFGIFLASRGKLLACNCPMTIHIWTGLDTLGLICCVCPITTLQKITSEKVTQKWTCVFHERCQNSMIGKKTKRDKKTLVPGWHAALTQHAGEPDGQVLLHGHQGGFMSHCQPLVILEDVRETGAVPLC